MSNARRRRRNDAKYNDSDKGHAARDRYNASRRKTKPPTTALTSYLLDTPPPSQTTSVTDKGGNK
jgi:hypothetical protein